MAEQRTFTLEEANALVPTLQQLFAEIGAARERITAAQPALWPVLKKSAMNGGNAQAGALVHEFERVKRCVHAIQATGAEVKDLDTGLVDFPTLRNGQVVYLCWRYGEDRIQYWHEIETGFAGRKPI